MPDRREVRQVVAIQLEVLAGVPVAAIGDDSRLLDDLGVDSFTAVSLLGRVEDALGQTLPEGTESNLAGVRTVGELVDVISTSLARRG